MATEKEDMDAHHHHYGYRAMEYARERESEALDLLKEAVRAIEGDPQASFDLPKARALLARKGVT